MADAVIVGGGIAGISAALELLDHGKSVLIVDRDSADKFGGQAITAFGGMMIVGTPIQKLLGVKDSPELALKDWCNTANFSNNEALPRKWAEMYCHRSLPDVYQWVKGKGIKFLPSVMWPERGFFGQGNSLPRYHIVWGTGYHCVSTLIKHLLNHKNKHKLSIKFNHRVIDVEQEGGNICGVCGKTTDTDEAFIAKSGAVVISCGGIGGDLNKVRALWPEDMGQPPEKLFVGSHPFCDGTGLEMAKKAGGVLANLGYMWNYPEGVEYPDPHYENHGLRVLPPKSALWMDYRGRRFGPIPLIGYYDTTYSVRRICRQEKKYSWHIMNFKIASKELAFSGAEHNQAIRDRKLFALLKNTLLGNKALVEQALAEIPDFISANNVPELAKKMNALAGSNDIDVEGMEHDIKRYDEQIDRGVKFHNDDQLRRIASARTWWGDRIRTCKFQKIIDPRAMPLIAVRYRVMTRKCLGGIRTDLQSRVVDINNTPIPGLYAAGESAGFGGGGISGKSSLEGTFIASSILSGRIAGRSIAGISNP